MKVAIIYYALFDLDGKKQTVGGVQTYLLALSRVCTEMGLEPVLFQFAKNSFETRINDLKVVGVPVDHLKFEQKKKCLYKAAVRHLSDEDILIFGADHISVPTDRKRCLSIQHGIAWDLPAKYLSTSKLCQYKLGAKLKKLKARRDAIKRFENCSNRVCVDYNFLNWYRTYLGQEQQGQIWVIPNFTQVASIEKMEAKKSRQGPLKVIFARRFVEFRGSRIMAEVAAKLLKKYPQIEFTFAGEGPDEVWLRDYFKDEPHVAFCKYWPEESIDIHLNHHVAVVPSLASEGTSLSVAEAMGAGCAVVATDVGGMTNMIIDGYNGVLVSPNTESLYHGLESVISNDAYRQQLSERGYDTAAHAFCLDNWKQKWAKVLQIVSKQ